MKLEKCLLVACHIDRRNYHFNWSSAEPQEAKGCVTVKFVWEQDPEYILVEWEK